MQTKPHNHTWRNKMLVAFQPPVRGSCFGLWGVPAMERSGWRCWQMERQGRVLVQLCFCVALLVPLSVWVLGLLLGRGVVDSSSTAPLQADLCIEGLIRHLCCCWKGMSKVFSAPRAEDMGTETAGAGHLLQQLWWHPKASSTWIPHCCQGAHRPCAEPGVCTNKTAGRMAWRAHPQSPNRREIPEFSKFWDSSNLERSYAF